MNRAVAAWLAVVAAVALSPAATFAADQLMVIPFSQKNVQLPHPAHEGGQITLRAILRDANCNTGYRVWWDVNRNGNYDDDWARDVARESNSNMVRDLGRTFLVPNVPRDSSLNINVRVRNKCDNTDKFGTFRIFVYNWRPSNDPRNWTAEQVEIMSAMAAQEVLWYLHRQVNNHRGYNTSGIYSWLSGCGSYCRETEALSTWLFAINGHMPAFPPNTVDWYGRAVPNGWNAANDQRWNADPYAETSMRLINDALVWGSGHNNIVAGEEGTNCGYNQNGQETQCPPRIAGTTDNRGAYIAASTTRGTHQQVYAHGMFLGAMATVLPALADVPIQTGGLAGNANHTWQYLIQQMSDWMGAAQIDGGGARGSWYYDNRNGSYDDRYEDGSTTQWAFIGLESAEVAGGPFGVVVNNRHKYRIADYVIGNQRADGGAAYRSGVYSWSWKSSFQLTGGSFVGARWLGVHNMQRGDATVAFPGNSGYTRDRLRQAYDTYLAYTATNWSNAGRTGTIGWQDRNWQAGDYLCGNTNAIYNAGRCGNSYSMYSHQKGYRTGAPQLNTIGNNDWAKQFSTYYIRAQDRAMNVNDPASGYSIFGRVRDDFCDAHSVTCAYANGFISAAMGGLVLTPTIFQPNPVAIGTAQPNQVTEGCAGGNAGLVTFDHSASFHPNASSRIIAYQWDVDAGNGLWWATNADPDFETPGADGQVADSWQHRYLRNGRFTATLRVIDNVGKTKTSTVEVVVNEAANVPPSAAHGGPYALEVGQALQLAGRGADQNTGCGDRLTIAWDLDNDGQFDDASGESPAVAWAALLAALPLEQANTIRIRVTDAAGSVATAQTTLTIYPRDPVAVARANPNPAACEQQVTFDASASFHPNPDRSIAQTEWDVNNVAGFDGAGPIFRWTYNRFGTYNITARVTDDLGRSNTAQFQVVVDQGNVAPVPRVSQNNYVVLEGGVLVLDARTTSDANTACGDRVVSYEWDLDNDGIFGEPGVDASGANPTVAWAQLLNTMQIADPATGLPINTVTLRVTDSFGVTATIQTTVTILPATPIVIVSQRPKPSPISLVNGFTRTGLDGRESHSPIPGVTIDAFDWDLDDDGAFETTDQAVVDFIKIFNPIPGPQNIPDTYIRLRVTDSAGRTAVTRYLVIFRVPPTPPTADADPTDPPEEEYHILIGEGVTLDGSQSFDPDSDNDDYVVFYRWDLTYVEADGFNTDFQTQAQSAADQPAKTVNLTAAQLTSVGVNAPGNYTVRLQVEDLTELTNEDSSVLHVYPVNPIAAATANPNPAACGGRVTFDARGSAHGHPDIEVVAWRWDLDGDGQYDDAEGAIINHRFDQFTFAGPYRIGLQVEDSRGNLGTSVIEVDVTAGNRSPVANAGGYRDADGNVAGPYAVAVGDGLQLSALGSADPDAACGDAIVRYQWDVNGDGTFDIDSNEPVPPELTPAQLAAFGIAGVGSIDLTLRVTDRFGATTSSTATLRVVNGPTARAAANPSRAGCEEQVTFSGEASSTDGPANQDFDIVAYAWDLDGDGQYDDASTARFTRPVVGVPDNNGLITVAAGLRVTDAGGRTSTTVVEVTIDVQNLPPVAVAGGPYATGPVGNSFAAVTLDGRGSHDPNAPCDAIVTYKWDTDNDGLYGADDPGGDIVGATVQYTNAGWQINTVQTVRLVVCDQAGVCSPPAEATIEVRDEAPPSGEIVSPRAGGDFCGGPGNFNLDFRVSDPEGDRVTVTATIANVQVGQLQVNTNANGAPVDGTMVVNTNQVPEGNHEIVLTFVDVDGGRSTATSGGRITFDRTAPVVTIGAALREGVCFNPNQVPVPATDVADVWDATPSVHQEVIEDGCHRTLRVTATDTCGNVGIAERGYLLAVPVEVNLTGVGEGELVSSARLGWDIVGPAQCASNIAATISRNGAQAAPYGENTEVRQPGNYALTVNVANCQGVARRQIRNFSVNAPPVAVPLVAGHPNTDANQAMAYLIAEGSGLQVDGSDSRAPEAADRIARYQWDFTGDGQFDAEGVLAAFPTDDDGIFNGRLRVTDGLGATHEQAFRVTVTDVDPIADAGGPYQTIQGDELTFDGRGSRPGSAADPISLYTWSWGDGTPDSVGANLDRPAHTFMSNGVFNVRLTVRDEDSETSVVVRVEVRDVDPVIDAVDQPADSYEIVPMTFSVDATAGHAADPITRYEWDFNNDGRPEYAGAQLQTVKHQFRDAGRYTVSVTVRDGDSASVQAIEVVVREITLVELIDWFGVRIDAAIDAGVGGGVQLRLTRAQPSVADGLWGERYGRRGNTLLAIDKMLSETNQAQVRGFDLGLEHWAMGRQLWREVTRMEAEVLARDDGPDANDPSISRAQEFLVGTTEIYEDADFADDARSDNRVFRVQDLRAQAFDAYYWIARSVDPCTRYNSFDLDDEIADPIARAVGGNAVNADLTNALTEMAGDMQGYLNAGAAAGDTGPGRDDVARALSVVEDLLTVVPLIVGECPFGEDPANCISDEQALVMELQFMQLARDLQVVASRGVYTRLWQNCLVLATKFRIELSIIRVEVICGRNRPIPRRARAAQAIGLEILADQGDLAALGYYIHPDRECLLIEIYNECLVPAIPQNELYEFPNFCGNNQEELPPPGGEEPQ